MAVFRLIRFTLRRCRVHYFRNSIDPFPRDSTSVNIHRYKYVVRTISGRPSRFMFDLGFFRSNNLIFKGTIHTSLVRARLFTSDLSNDFVITYSRSHVSTVNFRGNSRIFYL